MTDWVSVAAVSRDLQREEVVATDADRGSSLEGKGPEHAHFRSRLSRWPRSPARRLGAGPGTRSEPHG